MGRRHTIFPAALQAGVSTTLVMYARTNGWTLRDVTVDVNYDHRSMPRRFEIAIQVGGDLRTNRLERIGAVARAGHLAARSQPCDRNFPPAPGTAPCSLNLFPMSTS